MQTGPSPKYTLEVPVLYSISHITPPPPHFKQYIPELCNEWAINTPVAQHPMSTSPSKHCNNVATKYPTVQKPRSVSKPLNIFPNKFRHLSTGNRSTFDISSHPSITNIYHQYMSAPLVANVLSFHPQNRPTIMPQSHKSVCNVLHIYSKRRRAHFISDPSIRLHVPVISPPLCDTFS